MRALRVGLALSLCAALAAAQEGIPGAKRPGPVKVDEFNDRPKSEPRKGGEVVEAVSAGFRSLDAYQDSSSTTSEVVHGYIEESLVDGDVETWEDTPKLAERWDVEDIVGLKDGKTLRGVVTESGDKVEVKPVQGEPATVGKGDVKEIRRGTSFTFHLRKGVKFHNGDDFTAADVLFSWKLYRSPKNGMPSIQGYFNNITECTVIDDFTVRLAYSEQYWMALNVVGGYLYVRPHKAWDPDGQIDKDPDAFFKKFQEHPLMMKPIGTGPYQLDSYKKDFEVVLKRNEAYWDKNPKVGVQYPDRLRFRIIKDIVAQLKALENGEVDYVTQIPPEQFDDFFAKPEHKKDFAAVTNMYTAYRYVGFNLRRDLWKDRKVRLALAYASVDQDKFIRDILKGRAERVAGDYYKYSDSYDLSMKPIPYDPKKAEELLGEAGWFDSDGDGILDKDGKKFEFEMLVREMPPTMPLIQYLLQMQANLKKLGIKMEIRKLEWTAFLDKIEKGDYQACLLGWAMSSPPSHQDNYQIWHSSQIGENGSNHVAYANKEVDELLVKVRRELDPKKRHEMEFRIQHILFEDQPYNWMYMAAEHRAYNKKWHGVRFWVPRPGASINEWYLGN